MNPAANSSSNYEINHQMNHGTAADESKNIRAMNCRSGNPSTGQAARPAICPQTVPVPGQTAQPNEGTMSMPCQTRSVHRTHMPCHIGSSNTSPMPCFAANSGMKTTFRPSMGSCRSALMNQVYQTGFAVDDILLYLDTHPCDSAALAYYQHVRSLYQNAVRAYESQYGPLFMTDVDDQNYWTWINEPWPWEGGCI